ncbi:hypothetical protein HPB52_006552 [Rhipicephalus sanguineus]|uniref:Reverse transcriptase domain-containing protein n=1 Tax=Rhipicephalus sanguineus TaxID=34632 RepID=A0A9D4QGV3_RHISA|nr:hypothetical protein HPB52_006552 [Rhipicephalus sanguineus]
MDLMTSMVLAYDNVSRSAIVRVMQWLQLPLRVCDFVVSLLAHRTICIRVGKERTGNFVTKQGVQQGSVLAPILFNITLLPLACQLASIPDAFFLLYADDLTVWTLHPNLQRQQHALQSTLDKASDRCARIGLTLSATKTAFMSITNTREILPWLKAQASDNRPLTRLRQSNRQV